MRDDEPALAGQKIRDDEMLGVLIQPKHRDGDAGDDQRRD
jgi:hypothetical protein